MPEKHSPGLLEIFAEHSPRLMPNGQIRMECPFRENHKDGSGRMSFYASPDIGAYHCFSCHAKGNLVRLLTTRFGVNFFDAVGMVRLTDYKKEKDKVFDLDISWSVSPPKDFLKRGFTENTLRHFRLGETDDGWIIIPFYENFNSPADLLGYQKRRNVPDRITINNKGFNKKEYLYNLDTSYSYVILVEGYSDVFRLYQHGYNASALLGSTISKWQSEKLAEFDRVYLALDNDEPGRRATEKCYEMLKNDTDVRLVPYHTKDPGECISRKKWAEAFQHSTDYAEYSYEMCMGWEHYLEMREDVLRELKEYRL